MSWDLRLRITIFVFLSFVLPVSTIVAVDVFTTGAADPRLSAILFATVSALLLSLTRI